MKFTSYLGSPLYEDTDNADLKAGYNKALNSLDARIKQTEDTFSTMGVLKVKGRGTYASLEQGNSFVAYMFPVIASAVQGVTSVRINFNTAPSADQKYGAQFYDSNVTSETQVTPTWVTVKAGTLGDVELPLSAPSANVTTLRIFRYDKTTNDGTLTGVLSKPTNSKADFDSSIFDTSKKAGFSAPWNGTWLNSADDDQWQYVPAVWLEGLSGTSVVAGDKSGAISTIQDFAGKTIVFMGDSWCAGSGDGHGAWAKLFQSQFNLSTTVNKGHPGADWWQAANNYHFPFDGSTAPDPLPDTCDYLVVEEYTNGLYQDMSSDGLNDGRTTGAIPFGTPNLDAFFTNKASLDTAYPDDSWCKRADWVLGMCARKYATQGTKLLLIAPYRAPKQAGPNSAFLHFHPMVQELARKWGFAVYDRFLSSQIPYWDTTLAEPFMWHKSASDAGGAGIDNIHLGLAGNKVITPGIIEAMKRLG